MFCTWLREHIADSLVPVLRQAMHASLRSSTCKPPWPLTRMASPGLLLKPKRHRPMTPASPSHSSTPLISWLTSNAWQSSAWACFVGYCRRTVPLAPLRCVFEDWSSLFWRFAFPNLPCSLILQLLPNTDFEIGTTGQYYAMVKLNGPSKVTNSSLQPVSWSLWNGPGCIYSDLASALSPPNYDRCHSKFGK